MGRNRALGDYNAVSFNGNKMITGSSGGMFLTNNKEDADKVRKWSTQSREAAPWYQHEEMGYNYRMSNIIAGIVRGQIPYLEEHIAQKTAIWQRYEEGFKDLPVKMNPWDREKSIPSFWLSSMIIDEDAMAPSVRGEHDYLYKSVKGKSSPHEILEALACINAEGDQSGKQCTCNQSIEPTPLLRQKAMVEENPMHILLEQELMLAQISSEEGSVFQVTIR